MHDGRDALGHDHERSVSDVFGQLLAQARVGFVVEGAKRVVEHHDLRLFGQGAGDGQTLALTARDVGAALADGGVVAALALGDKVLGLGDACGLVHVVIAHHVAGKLEVALDGAREQATLLRDVTNAAAKLGKGHIAHVDAVERNAAAGDVVQARDELHKRGLARTRGADDAEHLAGVRGEVHTADDIGAGIGILEAHVVEGELTARRVGRGQFGRDGVVDARGTGDDLFHALGCDFGAGQDDRHHGEDHKRHDDLHSVGDKRHHVADLHHAVRHALRAKPDDKHGDAVHNEHHERHHKAHGAVGVELRGHQVERSLVKTLELMLLAVERADGHKAVEQLAGGKVHAVHKALHLFELGHGEAHKHADDGRDRDDGHGDGPLQTGVVGQDTHDSDDAHDGGHQAHADKQGCGHLDLLNVVGAAGDERSLAKLAHLGRREVHNLVEGLAAQVAGDGAGGARSHGAGQDGGDKRHQAQAKHRGRHAAQVGVLHVGGVDTLCLVLVLHVAHGALGHDGARHGAHFVRHTVGALDELALVD